MEAPDDQSAPVLPWGSKVQTRKWWTQKAVDSLDDEVLISPGGACDRCSRCGDRRRGGWRRDCGPWGDRSSNWPHRDQPASAAVAAALRSIDRHLSLTSR